MIDHKLEEFISSRNEFVGIDVISHFFSKWYQIFWSVLMGFDEIP